MQLQKANISTFRNFSHTSLNLVSQDTGGKSFTIASPNGGGKSTLLQLIFIMLHCFKDKSKHRFIKNILAGETYTEETPIINFEFQFEESNYFLKFIAIPNNYKAHDLSAYEDLKDLEVHLASMAHISSKKDLTELSQLLRTMNNSNRIDPLVLKRLSRYRRKIKTMTERRLYENVIETKDVEAAKEIINVLIESAQDDYKQFLEIKNMHDEYSDQAMVISELLESENREFILNIGNNFGLITESNLPPELQNEIKNNIYLSAPASQVFLFLDEEEKSSILNLNNKSNVKNGFNESNLSFDDFEQGNSRLYADYVGEAKNNLNGFFTYDFTNTELISSSFDDAFRKDKQEKIETGNYGCNYDLLVNELNNFLEGKTISQNETTNEIIFKIANSNTILKAEELSHGELKKLSLYIWIKHIVKPGSLVLIDELDIALHPKWQEDILSDLEKWGLKNTYFVATHSPQIINSIDYKNIRLLRKADTYSEIDTLSEPPLDRDNNTIISEIMGANYFPIKLKELHDQYRNIVSTGKHNSENGKKLRALILTQESENSEFFQEIQYDIDEKDEE